MAQMKKGDKQRDYFIINAKNLTITEFANWQWKNDSDGTQVAKAVSAKWLEVKGSFETMELLMGRRYKVSFLTRMEATNWSDMGGEEVSLKLQLPDDTYQVKNAKLPRVESGVGKWHALEVGQFTTTPQNVGTMTCAMDKLFRQWSGGLVIKGVEIKLV